MRERRQLGGRWRREGQRRTERRSRSGWRRAALQPWQTHLCTATARQPLRKSIFIPFTSLLLSIISPPSLIHLTAGGCHGNGSSVMVRLLLSHDWSGDTRGTRCTLLMSHTHCRLSSRQPNPFIVSCTAPIWTFSVHLYFL